MKLINRQWFYFDLLIILFLKNKQVMLKSQYKSCLLLNIKSLTQTRHHKNYLLAIQSKNIENQCQIQNIFRHNYQYIYKLWPCTLMDKTQIKIEMFEKIQNQKKEQIVVKRGEARPIIEYNVHEQKYQFYGNQKEKCLLILKFRVQIENIIGQEPRNNVIKNNPINYNLDLSQKNIKSIIKQNQDELRQKNLQNQQKLNTKKYIKNNRDLQPLNQERTQSLSPPTAISKKVIDANQNKTLQVKKKGHYRYHTLNISENLQSKKNEKEVNIESMFINKQNSSFEGIIQAGTVIDNTIVRKDYFPSRVTLFNNDEKTMIHKTRRRVASHNEQIQKDRKMVSIFKDIEDIQVANLKSHTIVSKPKKIKWKCSLILSNFKAFFHIINNNHFYKLILIFQKCKYQTPTISGNSKKLIWKNSFYLEQVQKKSFLHYRIVSVNKINLMEEGETQIMVEDFIQQGQKICRSNLEINGTVVGYLQFQFQCTKMLNQRKLTEKVNVSLPKVFQKINNTISNCIEKRMVLKKKKQKIGVIKSNKDLSPQYNIDIQKSKQENACPIDKICRFRSIESEQIVNSNSCKYENSICQSRIKEKRWKFESKLI